MECRLPGASQSERSEGIISIYFVDKLRGRACHNWERVLKGFLRVQATFRLEGALQVLENRRSSSLW